ncbi:hypothetical protein BJ508DRAFT_306264 [Ascobolus immersus RN42]|uniref:Uncharacterized protein n=1 Tax=Ascobolus immersus RN42 TaxID=1160509 RepID=A0A3N4I842_ASCIM|nr:hypothetical protein BJ508DRAFT_306264 [Ascobolus immersus RN42]
MSRVGDYKTHNETRSSIRGTPGDSDGDAERPREQTPQRARKQSTPRANSQRQTSDPPKNRHQSREVVVSPSRSLRLSQVNSSPPHEGSSRVWDRNKLQLDGDMEEGTTETHDGHGDESEAVDEDDDLDSGMAALNDYITDEREAESRQAKIEAEYNAQKERKKGHWCRKYSAVVLLASKVRK